MDRHPPLVAPVAGLDTQSDGSYWAHEMRRTAQFIMPNLLIGSCEAARNLATLHRHCVTTIIVLRAPNEALFLKPRFPQAFQYHVLDMADREEQNIITLLPAFRDRVDDALEHPNGRVLVHDDNGISRAPAMVILYLMDKFGASFEQVRTHVQNRRYCVYLNGMFEEQCKAFEAIRLAKTVHGEMPARLVDRQRKREQDIEDELAQQREHDEHARRRRR